MDHISGLPDEILCHILSFIPTKRAALTSVLSTRWRDLIAFVPNLYIDDSAFLHPELRKRERYEILQSFMAFVDSVLALQGDSPIGEFSLKCKTASRDRVDGWICNVLQRGVSDVELLIEDDVDYLLPQEMLVIRTLTKLRLRNARLPGGVEAAFFLPMLKTLVLKEARVYSDKLEMLLPTLPVLEELYIHPLTRRRSRCTVSSASLKELGITVTAEGKSSISKSFSFDTPNLLYLNYCDFMAEDYPKVNLSNVVEVVLNLIASTSQINQIRSSNNNNEVLWYGNVWKLMNGIRNVKKLAVSDSTFQWFPLCCELVNNLEWLRFCCFNPYGCKAMPVILRKCPHLDTLVFQGLSEYWKDKCRDACDCISQEDKSRLLMKKIQIKGFRGTNAEMGVLAHFLKYFPCLKEIEIYAGENCTTDIFEHIVKLVNLYNESYQLVVHFLK
uniref:F-box domain-containing protein n=1 Tax=Brassica oleracea TaxID=3712 RepID=A0A3P6B5L2_BRAOL|nr:unnamed protein product [Brassica oleracea]